MDKIINIAGVVGVGKSSLCNIFNELDYKVYHEPVFDNELLEKFYYDKEKYAFPLQIFFLNKRFEMYKDSTHHSASIMDRSIVEDRIFAKMLRDQGELDTKEYEIYVDLFNNMMEHVNPPNLMVYLRIKTENVIDRIKRRGRKYELEQSINYWYDLNSNYEVFFNEYTWSKLLVVDVDEIDFVKNEKDKNYMVTLIEENLHVPQTV
jgi:deoxyadenosine/deoxycytidine kinase